MWFFKRRKENKLLETKAVEYLRRFYGVNAQFREGQLEAVLSVLNGKRSLIVQKTGWGKSLVYFLSTKILRDSGNGLTLIISPLLALMNNQLEFAKLFELKAMTIHSHNAADWKYIKEKIMKNDVDILFISPERLAKASFNEEILQKINIGMLVIDEAHCISDWGHDFRPDYRRIAQTIKYLPHNIPLLATTATANKRVVEDVSRQLGKKIRIQRGCLVRESLSIHIIHIDSKAERLAWLKENLPNIHGVGIVYCLTKRDCDLVNKWLRANEIDSYAYYSGIVGDDSNTAEERLKIEKLFLNNKMKVLVATTAFGMGIDKADISFVIHFQKPGNIIAYYQQIGRAGRGLDRAYAVLLAGDDDDRINEYFIKSAFPTLSEMEAVIEEIEYHDSISDVDLIKHVDIATERLEKVIRYLELNGVIYEETPRCYRSHYKGKLDMPYIEKITETRKEELKRMNDFIATDKCLMNFIVNDLSVQKVSKCGKCSNCMGHFLFKNEPESEIVDQANQMIIENFCCFEPRTRWEIGKKIEERYRSETGIALSYYGDSGWGRIVSEDKYKKNHFRDELVIASANCIRKDIACTQINWITSVPSLRRPELVREFAKRLADELNLPYSDSFVKKDAVEQKCLNNNIQQRDNAWHSFEIKKIRKGNVLLVDDMVDSRWTFTVCAFKLRKHGTGLVFPFALSNTSKSEDTYDKR